MEMEMPTSSLLEVTLLIELNSMFSNNDQTGKLASQVYTTCINGVALIGCASK